eukprot:Gb_29795 [translate_table: standard]
MTTRTALMTATTPSSQEKLLYHAKVNTKTALSTTAPMHQAKNALLLLLSHQKIHKMGHNSWSEMAALSSPSNASSKLHPPPPQGAAHSKRWDVGDQGACKGGHASS